MGFRVQADFLLRVMTGFSVVYAVVAMAAWTFDSRTIANESVWLKPLKFGLSTALYLATLCWALRCLSDAWRQGQFAWWVSVSAALCTLFELVYIGVQAAQGEASHFNVGTPYHAAMYGLMAVAAVLLVLCSGAIGMMAALDIGANGSSLGRWSVALAFPLSAALTILTGLSMGGRMTHHVGVTLAGAAQVPFTGWSLRAGDLRVPHFLAMHLLQAGPLFAWVVSQGAGTGVGTAAAGVFCLLWSALTLWLLRLAREGKPLTALWG